MLDTILAIYSLVLLGLGALLNIADDGRPKTPTTPRGRLVIILFKIPVIVFLIRYLF